MSKQNQLLKLILPIARVKTYRDCLVTHNIEESGKVFFVVSGLALQNYANYPASDRGLSLAKIPGDFAGIRYLFPEYCQGSKIGLSVAGTAEVGSIKQIDLLRLLDYPTGGRTQLLFEEFIYEKQATERFYERRAILSPQELVFAHLQDHATELGTAHPHGTKVPITVSTLARLTGMSEEAIRRTTAILAEKGLLCKAGRHFLLFE